MRDHVVSAVFATHVGALAAVLRLLLGVKLNPLRQRMDSFRCDREQALLATLGSAVLVFLAPTVAVFHAAAAADALAHLLVPCSLALVRGVVERSPGLALLLCAAGHADMAAGVRVEVVGAGGFSHVRVRPRAGSTAAGDPLRASSDRASCDSALDAVDAARGRPGPGASPGTGSGGPVACQATYLMLLPEDADAWVVLRWPARALACAAAQYNPGCLLRSLALGEALRAPRPPPEPERERRAR